MRDQGRVVGQGLTGREVSEASVMLEPVRVVPYLKIWHALTLIPMLGKHDEGGMLGRQLPHQPCLVDVLFDRRLVASVEEDWSCRAVFHVPIVDAVAFLERFPVGRSSDPRGCREVIEGLGEEVARDVDHAHSFY